MGNTEMTFADKLGRGYLMQETINNFDPIFNPVDTDLTPANFLITLDGITAKNSLVDGMRSNYTTNVGLRNVMVKDLKSRSSLTMDVIKSAPAFKQYKSTVHNIVKKILNYRPPKTSTPTGGENPEETKKRNRGEQSFADLSGLFTRLVGVITEIVGYDPPNPILKLAEMTNLDTTFKAKNKEMGDLLSELELAIKERYNMYNGENSLKEKMKAIKAATRSQYGADSVQYETIKGIKV